MEIVVQQKCQVSLMLNKGLKKNADRNSVGPLNKMALKISKTKSKSQQVNKI
jgi:hypothetical protein